MTDVARCECGAVEVVVTGEPTAVVVCHCLDCQKRSGSVFGIGAYFPKSQVTISGKTTAFTRPTDEGRRFTHHFCPSCGSTLYWITEKHPDGVGVAVGNFADPGFGGPDRSVWEQSRHDWVVMPDDVQHFPKGRG